LAATLGIIEAEAAVAQLLAKDAVLLNDVALLAVDPGGGGDGEKLGGWRERSAHDGKNLGSIDQTRYVNSIA